MDTLGAILAITVAIALLYELSRRLQVPWPSLFVIGGLALGFVPGLPKLQLEPELVLLVFLPRCSSRRPSTRRSATSRPMSGRSPGCRSCSCS